jgi:hypothetical protein
VASIRFEEHRLTSFSGLVVIEKLMARLGVRKQIADNCRHLKQTRSYRHSTIMELLIVHVLLGFRKLREVQAYAHDPLVKLCLRLKRLPGVSTISRMLPEFDEKTLDASYEMNRLMILRRLKETGVRRVTMDFDGSVQSTRRHAEGTAVGFNKKKKGARSYYNLYCTIAQVGEVFDVLHRSGNVHDSNGAIAFACRCIQTVRAALPGVVIEVRMDSAFFSEEMIKALERSDAEYTISVPFERFVELKNIIEARTFWWWLRKELAYFEKRWKPKSWNRRARFLFIRKRVKVQHKEPIQLDFFLPDDHNHEYKVIITNKKACARKVVRYHEGRGYQENIFSELKSLGAMEYIPVRTWIGNKIYLFCNILAHNLMRELQMATKDSTRGTTEKRTPLWIFETLSTARRMFLCRAGRLTHPHGNRTLTVDGNEDIKTIFMRYFATT